MLIDLLKGADSLRKISTQKIIEPAHGGTIYRIDEQQSLGRVCATAQTRYSLHCSHTHYMDVDEDSDQNLDPQPG